MRHSIKLWWMLAVVACLAFSFLNVSADGTPQITCDATEKSNEAGVIVTYNCTLTNTSADTDNFDIIVDKNNGWNAWSSLNSAPNLVQNGTAPFTISVAIPPDAALGDSAVTIVTARAATGGASTAVNLTTRFVPPPATLTPTVTLTPTHTPPAPVTRPLVVMSSYSFSDDHIEANDGFTLKTRFTNTGGETATNIIISFTSTQILPRDTGGVLTVASLAPGASVDLNQPMLSMSDLTGNAATVSVTATYADQAGEPFTGTFTVTVGINASPTATPVYSGAAATATPTAVTRAQIVVSGYSSDVDPLQPGTTFNLNLEIRNLGNADAKSVTLVLGGGGSEVDTSSGTPVPGGGMQGGSGDLSKFAPLGSSNLYYLNDIPAGAVQTKAIKLIVNVDTQPGAYPLKLSFVYNDSKNNRLVDDQVITMLVYALPRTEINFYRDPGVLIAGQPNTLPVQVMNIGRNSAVLGNLKITATGAEIQNGTGLVGVLDAGNTFPLDAMIIPQAAGQLEVTITVSYTDDFNTVREIKQTMVLAVMEAPAMEPGMGEGMEGIPMPVEPQPETTWDKVLRFVKGLLGLGSGQPQPAQPGMPMPGEMPPGETPPQRPVKPLG